MYVPYGEGVLLVASQGGAPKNPVWYNNIAANGSTGAGLGYLYIVDIRTGALLQRISTGSGTEASPAGLAQVTAYSPNAADGTVTEVYGGDLNGRVWRSNRVTPRVCSRRCSRRVMADWVIPRYSAA